MKKNIIILILIITVTDFGRGQNLDCDRIAFDTVECVIGSDFNATVNYDWAHANILARRVSIELLSMQNQVLDNLDYGDFSYCNDGVWGAYLYRMATFKIKFKWDTLYSDPMYKLKISTDIPNIVGDHGVRIRNLIVKPKYPILNPIIDDTVYCGTKVTFNFAALGLDEDTLYSYEVVDSAGNSVSPLSKGFMITLDSLLNVESLFSKAIIIRGLYDSLPFKYKYSSTDGKIDISEWKIVIRGPRPPDMKVAYEWRRESGEEKLCLKFHYNVGSRIYIPLIKDGTYSVFKEPPGREIPYKDIEIPSSDITKDENSWAYLKILNIERGQPFNLTVKFIDQYNEITEVFSIPN